MRLWGMKTPPAAKRAMGSLVYRTAGTGGSANVHLDRWSARDDI
jgi:hypothetical protein